MKTFILLPTLILLGACSVKAGSGSAPAQESAPTVTAEITELPLPAVPDSLRAPASRATYILERFWDGMDFADTVRAHNADFMELNFVNFINLYPLADNAALPAITADFLKKATADQTTRSIVYDLIDKYLGSTDSPMHNDDSYITFLQQWVKLPLDNYELMEPQFRLASALKNRPGTKAADFKFITRDGSASSLSGFAAPKLLLIFYDPDCDHCNQTIARLRADDTLNNLIATGKLTVLAVYPETDTPLWESTKASMPANWTVGRDLTRVLDHELYDFPEMPGILLLDSDKTVILRQPSESTLDESLQQL